MSAFLFTTTDADSLYYRLEKKLFRQDASFRQLILVPHPLVKEAIFDKLLSGSVATGFKVYELGPGIDYLLRTLRFEEKKGHSFPAPMIFALHLQALIKEFLQKQHPLFAPLEEYINSFSDDKSIESRIQELAETLSLDFLHYGVYGGKGLEIWLQNPTWQTELFKKAFTSWDYPYRALQHINADQNIPVELEIHVFGFSFLPKVYDTFLSKLSSVFKIHHYYLTPTKEYFGLARSKKERIWLEKKGIEEDISEDNPLLANFGKQTKRRFLDLLDKQLHLEEFFYEDPQPDSFLKKVQQAIFANDPMLNSEDIERIDDSLEVHRCFSYKREIEVLLSTLLRLCAKHDIEPSDILVLAPDISVYFSFIKEIFDEQSPFQVSISGLEIQSQSPFLQAYSCLIEVLDSRFEKKDLIKLLGYPLIRERFGIAPEEIEQITKWLDQANVFWGYNLEHKKEILAPIQEESNIETSEEGTLYYGLNKLLLGLTSTVYEPVFTENEPFYPIESVSNDQIELFSKFFLFTKSLWEQRQEFTNKRLNLESWILVIKKSLESFFNSASCIDDGFSFFNQQLSTLEQLSFKIPTAQFSFFHLKRVFHKTFIKKSAQYASKNKNVIRFASLSSQQMLPSKVIVFLGMDEGSFPKAQATYPLREILYKSMDSYPLMIEEQRQFLLDGLLFAKNHLIFSYCYFDEKDGKQQDCSYLLKEVLETLDRAFTHQKKPIVKELLQTHGSIRFDRYELEGKHEEPYFILRDYELACAFYDKSLEKRQFFPEFYQKGLEHKSEVIEKKGPVLLSHLQQFARNPLKYYMTDTLGLKIFSDVQDQAEKKEFFLSSLDKSLCLKESLKEGISLTWNDQKLKGSLPQGFLGQVSIENYKEDERDLLEGCKQLGVDPDLFFTIELSQLCKTTRVVNSKHIIVPALEVVVEKEKVRVITGQIDLCHPKGISFILRNDFADLLRAWPIYLVYLCILERDFPNLYEQEAFFLKSGASKQMNIQNPFELLRLYILYFEKGCHSPSPLLPVWGESMLLRGADAQEISMQKFFFDSMHQQYLDEYQKWCFKHLDCFSASCVEMLWRETFQETFSDFIKWSGKETLDA